MSFTFWNKLKEKKMNFFTTFDFLDVPVCVYICIYYSILINYIV